MTSPNLTPRDDDPDWLSHLRASAVDLGIKGVADRIGKARPSVSLVLAGRYPAGLDEMERAVREKLMGLCRCPGLGREIPKTECDDWAGKPYAATSSHRVVMWQACQDCANRTSKGGKDAQ